MSSEFPGPVRCSSDCTVFAYVISNAKRRVILVKGEDLVIYELEFIVLL